MTPDEIKALRDKHVSDFCECGDCHPPFRCLGCYVAYPCDVIQLLDATENLKPNDLKVEVECDHNLGLHLIPLNPEKPVYLPYCPFCGEKRRHYD